LGRLQVILKLAIPYAIKVVPGLRITTYYNHLIQLVFRSLHYNIDTGLRSHFYGLLGIAYIRKLNGGSSFRFNGKITLYIRNGGQVEKLTRKALGRSSYLFRNSIKK